MIEDVLVGRSEEPIPVEGLAAVDAAYYVLDVTMHWSMAEPSKYPQDVALFGRSSSSTRSRGQATSRQRAHRPVFARS